MNLRACLPGVSFSVLCSGVTHLIHNHVVRFLSSPSCRLEGVWFSPIFSPVVFLSAIITAHSDFIQSLNPGILLLAVGVLQEIWNQIVLCAIESQALACQSQADILWKKWVKTWETMCSDRFLNESVSKPRSCTKDLFLNFLLYSEVVFGIKRPLTVSLGVFQW